MHRFGIYLNMSKIWYAQPGLTKDSGTLYVGPAAVENQIYERCVHKNTVKTYQKNLWWDFRLKSATVGGWSPHHVDFPPEYCGKAGLSQAHCMFDSGNPKIQLPKELFNQAAFLQDAAPQNPDGSFPRLTIDFELLKDPTDWDSETVTLSLPIITLKLLQKIGYVSFGSGLTLGLPFWATHFAVFDDDADTITWCEKRFEWGFEWIK